MSTRNSHLFEFTGDAIANAARARAAEIGVLVRGLEMELDDARRDLSQKIDDAVQARIVDLSCYLEPTREAGWSTGQSMSANEAPAFIEGPPQKSDITFNLQRETYARLHLLVHRLKQAQGEREKYLSAANRYASQEDRDFDLDVGDVDYFGLDKEST